MHIRSATLEDIPQIVKLGRKLWELHITFDSDYYQLEDSFEELFGSWVKEQLSRPNQFIFVAEDGNSEDKIVGFISGFIKALYPWFRTKRVGHISYLIITPEYRAKGIGNLLEKAAISWFKSKGISYVEVYVEEMNTIGVKAWHSYGFLPFKKFLRKKI